jgi:hypothetical protein
MKRSRALGWRNKPTRRPGRARSFALNGLAILGMFVVAVSAAVWGRSITQRHPAITVTLPPPRVTIHEPIRPATLERVAAKPDAVEYIQASLRRAAQSSRTGVHGNLASLAELNDRKRSRYTSLEPASCAIVKGTLPNVGSTRRCEGVGGYALEMADVGPQQYLAILTPSGERSDLELPYKAPDHSLGRLAEWRARVTGAPRAVIVRVSVAGNAATSSLIVAKLGTEPCIVAVIPRGLKQNEKARLVADREELACSGASVSALRGLLDQG